MISKEAFLGLIICISCKLVYAQILSVNDSNVAIAEALRSNIQNHRQSFDKPIEETLPKDPPKPVDDKKIHYIEPGVVTNSHKPQYFDSANYDTEATGEGNTSEKIDKINEKFDSNANNDQFNVEINDEYKDDYRPNHHLRNKHNQIKMVLVKLLEKKEQKRKFASVLPILRMLTPPQRLVMASLVSKQITADAKNPGLNIEQVKAMFGNDPNVTSDLMLPILLDIANMIRDAKDHMRAQEPRAPQAQLLRRSFNVDEDEGSMMESSYEYPEEDETMANKKPQAKSLEETSKSMKIAAKIPSVIKNSNVKVHGDLKVGVEIEDETADSADIVKGNLTVSNSGQSATMVVPINGVNTTMDLANSTIIVNGTELGEDLPVAEKLRALNRFIDRNGNIFVLARPPWSPGGPKIMVHPGPGPLLHRKSNNELLMASQRRRVPGPVRKNPGENKQKCDMFTNTLCLDTIDYPEDAIMGSIRRNQAAMGALLADFPEISADSAIDGISAKQENKYTAEHYLNSISRREDGMGPGSATGFMCPSTVKYARPQKARATSGQWKYIVNTGEHTQTLRLEKCLRPKEPCTYLTENFKSKCVQVYNYHRLLTWDQQNGLHMDIFKVPTCCSCHIEGYSVAFPPHASRPVESTSEHFPGEDLSHDVNPYEDGQPSIRHTSKFPIQAESFPILGDSHNIIPGSTFNKFGDDNPSFHDIKHLQSSNPFESVNNNYHSDLFQHGNANIRNVKKPPRVISGNIGLPSFLEPPSKPPAPVITNFIKGQESNVYQTKHKPFLATHYKRGAPGTQGHSNAKRPGRRPLRKKNSNVNDDQLVGATNVHENPTIINMETFEDINSSADEYERSSPRTSPIPTRTTTARTVGASTKFSLKNVSPTTERYRPKTTPAEHGTAVLKDISLNRRVNYNYHPIIDFFEEPSKKDMANDRMDNGSTYVASSEESDWRPMAPPVAFGLKGTSGETRPQ